MPRFLYVLILLALEEIDLTSQQDKTAEKKMKGDSWKALKLGMFCIATISIMMCACNKDEDTVDSTNTSTDNTEETSIVGLWTCTEEWYQKRCIEYKVYDTNGIYQYTDTAKYQFADEYLAISYSFVGDTLYSIRAGYNGYTWDRDKSEYNKFLVVTKIWSERYSSEKHIGLKLKFTEEGLWYENGVEMKGYQINAKDHRLELDKPSGTSSQISSRYNYDLSKSKLSLFMDYGLKDDNLIVKCISFEKKR